MFLRLSEFPAISLHVFLEMVGQVETSLDWFGSVFVVNRNFPKAFTEMVIQSAARFVDIFIYIFFIANVTGCVVDKIGRNAREMIGDGNRFLRSRNFVRFCDEWRSPTSYARHLNVPG